MEAIKDFAAKLLQEKGLDNLDQEVLDQMQQDLVDRLEDRINALILSKMPAEKLEEWNVLLDSASDEEMQKFCQDNIPDLDQQIANELLSFRSTYLNM